MKLIKNDLELIDIALHRLCRTTYRKGCSGDNDYYFSLVEKCNQIRVKLGIKHENEIK